MFGRFITQLKRGVAAVALTVGLGSAAMAADLAQNQVSANPDGTIAMLDTVGGDQEIESGILRVGNDVVRFDQVSGNLYAEINSGTKGLDRIRAELATIGITTGLAQIVEENDIRDADTIFVTPEGEQGYLIPYTLEPSLVAAAVAKAQSEPETVASSILPLNLMDIPDVTSAVFNPSLFGMDPSQWGPRVELVQATPAVPSADPVTATVDPVAVATDPVVVAASVATQNAINYFDEDLTLTLSGATTKFRSLFDANTKTDEQILYMAMGHNEAIVIANENGEECDPELGAMTHDEMKLHLSEKYEHATDSQINQMVHGFQIGADAGFRNDVLKDAMPYWVLETQREFTQDKYKELFAFDTDLAGYDAFVNTMAEESLQAYLDGKECVAAGCAPEEPVVADVPEIYKIVGGDDVCHIAIDLNRSMTDIINVNNLQPPYHIRVGQELILNGVGPLDKENDAIFKQHDCGGTPPPPAVSVRHTPTNGGGHVTPPAQSYIPPTLGGCEIRHTTPFGIDTYTLRSLSEEFRGLCGCNGEVFEHNFGNNGEPLWGDRRQECPRDGGDGPDPVDPPVVELPGGGCQKAGKCDGGSPNPDLGTDPVVGPGNPLPGAGDNDGEEPPKDHPVVEAPVKDHPAAEQPAEEAPSSDLDGGREIPASHPWQQSANSVRPLTFEI